MTRSIFTSLMIAMLKWIVYDFLPNILIILFLEFAFSWLMIDENEKEIVEDLVDGVAQEGRRSGVILT